MNEQIIKGLKPFINEDDLAGLQKYYGDLTDMQYDICANWQYIYRQVYLHACLKKKVAIVEWLTMLYSNFDAVTQIALRQMFPYGRYLLAR